MFSIDQTQRARRSAQGRFALAAVSALVLALPVAAGAGTIVLRSNGPSAGSYPPGKPLPENGSITLRPGDSVTVLDSRGTRLLRNNGGAPVTVSVAGTGKASASGIAALIADTGMRQTRTGATRSINNVSHPASVWYVDVAKPGTVCVASAKNITLWRSKIEQPASYTVTRLADGKAAEAKFRAGQAVAAWPADALPAASGDSYRITGGGLAAPVAVTVKLLSGAPASLDAVAAKLLDQGCESQVDILATATTLAVND